MLKKYMCLLTLCLLSCGCGSDLLSSQHSPQEKNNEMAKTAFSPIEIKKGIPEGTYKVGKDIPTGEYVIMAKDKTNEGSISHFKLSKDSAKGSGSLITFELIHRRSIVTVLDGQYLEISNAVAYPSSDSPI